MLKNTYKMLLRSPREMDCPLLYIFTNCVRSETLERLESVPTQNLERIEFSSKLGFRSLLQEIENSLSSANFLSPVGQSIS